MRSYLSFESSSLNALNSLSLLPRSQLPLTTLTKCCFLLWALSHLLPFLSELWGSEPHSELRLITQSLQRFSKKLQKLHLHQAERNAPVYLTHNKFYQEFQHVWVTFLKLSCKIQGNYSISFQHSPLPTANSFPDALVGNASLQGLEKFWLPVSEK